MRKIIEEGKLYLAMPPLYKISYNQENFFAYNEKDKDKILNGNKGSPQLTRFKGLGEMPANQLKDTTMDPEKRSLIQLKLADGIKCTKQTEKLFEDLMGKKAEKRFNFIQENANFINNLDI